MLIKTIHEMRIYMPSHAYKEIETRAGIYEDAENTVLLPILGAKLLRALNEYYATLPANAIVPRYIADDVAPADAIDQTLPMVELLKKAQKCIVYKAEEESADIDAVSRNNSGINLVSADGYDVAGKDALKAYKDRLWKKTHEAIDHLLVYLEELAKDPLLSPLKGEDQPAPVPDGSPSGSDGITTPEPPLTDHQQQAQQIVTLWRESRYYYLADGLLINTATKLQEFVDIQENRERFVQMLPDMRFIQRNYIRTEVGSALFDRLLDAMRDDKLTDEEFDLVLKMQELLALYTQQRSRVFKFDTTERRRIEEECIGLKRELLAALAEWHKSYNDDGNALDTFTSSQGGDATALTPSHPNTQTTSQGSACPCCTDQSSDSDDPYWGDKGSVFVMPGLI